ncbi:MAG: hypothetical protein HoeaKO_10830 [Hoeflea alexandrii]
MPKSSRSSGVAIITACVVPPKDSATGTSSGKARDPGVATPALTAMREATAVLGMAFAMSFPPECLTPPLFGGLKRVLCGNPP